MKFFPFLCINAKVNSFCQKFNSVNVHITTSDGQLTSVIPKNSDNYEFFFKMYDHLSNKVHIKKKGFLKTGFKLI